MTFRASLLTLALFWLVPAQAQIVITPQPEFTSRVVDVVTPPNSVNVRYLLVTLNRGTPVAGVILFAGDNGQLKISINGEITTSLAQNFLVRSRLLFARAGLAVAVVDTPGGVALDGNIRMSADYATEMGAVIASLRTQASVTSVWLIGTSTGTLSAAGIAARLPKVPQTPFPLQSNTNRPDGIVLTSTQSMRDSVAGCNKIVFDAALSSINVSTLVVANANDACTCSPPGNASAIVNAVTHAPRKASQQFSSTASDPSNKVCQALTPHGFYGIEQTVVNSIVAWMAGPPRR